MSSRTLIEPFHLLLDSLEKTALRLIALVVSALLLGTPAFAQSWREYVYLDDDFAVHFPSDPKIETGTYTLADGSTVPARIYSVSQEDAAYKVTVADFSHTKLGQPDIIEQAVKLLSQRGEVKVILHHNVSGARGRQFSIVGLDGSRASIALLYYRDRLYEIVGTALPAAARAGASELIRFQQSISFTRRGNGKPYRRYQTGGNGQSEPR